MEQKTSTRFHEEQSFRQWWIWLLIGGIAAIQWWGFIQQIVLGQPFGNRPAPDRMMVLLWLAFGIGLPAFFLHMRLAVTVTDTAIEIHYRPLARRTIPMASVTYVEARRYSPLGEYGGWGIRGWGSNRAYNVSGNRGVELNLADGHKVMIGSQRADDLAQAIAAARGN